MRTSCSVSMNCEVGSLATTVLMNSEVESLATTVLMEKVLLVFYVLGNFFSFHQAATQGRNGSDTQGHAHNGTRYVRGGLWVGVVTVLH